MSVQSHLQYVNRERVSGSLQPFQISNAHMWGLIFPADLERLQACVDRVLNRDPSGRVSYAAYLPMLMFGFSSIEYVTAVNPPYSEFGGAHECELAVWIPVRQRGSLSPMLFGPYLFVDNPLAVIQGREIFGFAKEMAELGGDHWPEHFPILGYVGRPTDPPGRRLVPVLTVERQGEGRVPRERRDWGSFSHAASDLRAELAAVSRLPALSHAAGLLRDTWFPNAPVVLCKEFSGCGDRGNTPCYLGVVEAGFRVTSIHEGYILKDPYLLRLPKVERHPIAADLGLRDGTPALLAYEMKFDFRLEPGKEVWCTALGRDRQPPSLLEQVGDLVTAVPERIVELGVDTVQSVASTWMETGLFPAPPPAPLPEPQPGGTTGKREKIAILGGGVGALTAAFGLTEAPGWRDRYEITVYQLGWRLGGKGASGRDHGRGDRIEEHGIHVWFGFYENAFRVIRRCFQALPGFDESAYENPIFWGFEPFDLVTLMRSEVDGSWKPAVLRVPSALGWPGAEENPPAPSTPLEYLVELLNWLVARLMNSELPPEVVEAGYRFADVEQEFARLLERLRTVRPEKPVPGIDLPFHFLSALDGAAALAGAAIGRTIERLDAEAISHVLDHTAGWLKGFYGAAAAGLSEGRLLWAAVDLSAALVRGMIETDAIIKGFESLNDRDFAEFLRQYGADQATIESPWVRAIYSQGFAFVGGDVTKGRAAAGMAIRGIGRMLLTYRRSFMFKMKGGMGDIIFAPLYEVLKARGVRFKFFHRVRKLHLSADKQTIERISVGRQATPPKNYPYLTKVKDLYCWPNQPRYDLLKERRKIEKLRATGAYVNFESAWSAWGPDHEKETELRAGEHFDRVILGIPVGSLGEICSELVEANRDWENMLRKLKTVRTQSFQLWLKKRVDEMGWPASAMASRKGEPVGPILTAFVEPLDTWGDMTHTLETENWPPEMGVKQIAYFCGVMPDTEEPAWYSDPSFPGAMKRQVADNVRQFLDRDMRHLWPDMYQTGVFDWEALVNTAPGSHPLDDQFFIANIDPSERYVMSVPGSVEARLRADRSGFSNLYLAGDWTLNGISAGCVEAATMSGLRAARAIGGWPERIPGEEHLDDG